MKPTTKTTPTPGSSVQEGTVHDANPRALVGGSHLAIDEARAGAALDAAHDDDQGDTSGEPQPGDEPEPQQLTPEAVVELTETLVRVPVRVIATSKGVRWNESHERRIAFTESDKAKLRPGAEQVAKVLAPYVSDSKWISIGLFGIALFDVVSAKLSMLAPEFKAATPTATRPRDP